MDNCKVLFIDNPADLRLLNESIVRISLPINLHYISTIADALEIIGVQSFDLVIVGSGLVINEGVESLLQFGGIPIVILCESSGFNRFFKDRTCNVCFITRPFEINRIPEMVKQAYEFWKQCGSKKTNTVKMV